MMSISGDTHGILQGLTLFGVFGEAPALETYSYTPFMVCVCVCVS